MAICLPVWHSQCKEPGLLFCRVWCSDELAVSGVASPKIWEGPKNLVEAKMLDFRRITLFFWKNASQSTKWLYFLKFFWGRPVLAPSDYAYACSSLLSAPRPAEAGGEICAWIILLLFFCSITITRHKIFKGSLQVEVVGVLPDVTV